MKLSSICLDQQIELPIGYQRNKKLCLYDDGNPFNWQKSHDNADFRNRWLKSFEQGTFVTSKNHWNPKTLCLFFTGNCPIKPPYCLCGHIIRSSCFIGYYYKAFQAFFCNHIIQFHDHFLLITQQMNSISFKQLS